MSKLEPAEVDQHFTFHVVGLPHTQTTVAYDNCAFTAKVRKFCDMMKSLGHTVYVYGSEDFECDYDEALTCITKAEQQDIIGVFGPEDIHKAAFGSELPHWQIFNRRVIQHMNRLIRPKDFICIMGGLGHKPITDAFPEIKACEFGIGYPGSYLPHRVFEAYAWMHMSYGHQQVLHAALGNNYDRVIPSYFEEELFPFSEEKDDYFMFIGRMTALKGWRVAVEACEAFGAPLVVAGLGEDAEKLPSWVDYRGLVGPKERGELMSRARAIFVPTLYVEPFGSVSAESMMTGTPVLTTDWGAFPELVRQGIDGFRCRTLQQFLDGMEAVDDLDKKAIRDFAMERFGMANVRWQYQDYFEDLYTLWDKGWYTLRDDAASDS